MLAKTPLFCSLAILFSLATLAQPPESARVAVIDIRRVLASTREGQSATNKLAERAAPKRDELAQQQNDINSLQERLRTGDLSEAAKQNLYVAIDQKTQRLRQETEAAEAEWNQDRQKTFQRLGTRVMDIINRYARDHGYVMVLDASPPQTPVLYASNATDITSAVIELFDKPAAPPRTPDGHSDFEGTWTNATMTLLERPIGLSWVLQEEDAAKYEKAVVADRSNDRRDGPPEIDVGRAYNDLFFDQGNRLARVGGAVRTSLIVDPPDGHLPPYTMEARRRIGAASAYAQEHPADRAQDRTLAERCLLWGAGPPMLPLPYNSNVQIVQTPEYVMILVEMMHDVRIIPLDGRPHLAPNVRQWMGDSRGHWESDTLVVDTTNFTGKTAFQGTGESLHVIERLRRVDPDTLLYSFTVDDPETFVRPWTAELPFTAAKGPVYEFACHEGNYALSDILKGARAGEQRVDEPAKK